ncbi:hypothetical protein CC86DRAFT_47604 [Ophiobolus disseminans]|uniref:Uncharacterized protein n=1 Tax=Ophiobolus disseminans TaxID=1469910 RepID=A0A6A6ZVH9_9PLEO|nr:hypothetical protein CC86DRAFT_47604 [Ophiobolus disseminans]
MRNQPLSIQVSRRISMDTGDFFRALLSLRSSLLSYDGVATTYDARVVCVPPVFRSVKPCNGPKGLLSNLCGVIQQQIPVRGLAVQLLPIPFNCTLSTATPPDDAWSLCILDKKAGGLLSQLDHTDNSSLPVSWHDHGNDRIPDGQSGSWSWNLGHAYLLLNLSSYSTHGNVRWNANAMEIDGPWILTSGYSTFRSTICYDAILTLSTNTYTYMQDHTVSFRGWRAGVVEPAATWNSTANLFNTADVRYQLLARAQNLVGADIYTLRLDSEHLLAGVRNKAKGLNPRLAIPSWLFEKIFAQSPGFSRAFCISCDNAINPVHVQVFNDILDETGSPALALQAHISLLVRTAYYTWLPFFNVPGEASAIHTKQRLVPVVGWGFWTVLALASTHFVLCIIITVLFVGHTNHSLLGNAWAAFAQVASTEEAHLLMRDGTLRPDKNVSRMLKETGADKAWYKVGGNLQSDGVRLTGFFKGASDYQAGGCLFL